MRGRPPQFIKFLAQIDSAATFAASPPVILVSDPHEVWAGLRYLAPILIAPRTNLEKMMNLFLLPDQFARQDPNLSFVKILSQ